MLEIEHQARYHEVGNSYWWLAGKYEIIMDLIGRAVPPRNDLAVLDAGCGPGNMLDRLSSRGTVTGSDLSSPALRFCRSRGYTRVTLSRLDTLALKAQSFDLVTAIDVLEHIPDDAAGLREIHRVLRPGGTVVITVPAFQVLWGDHDDIYGHYRRYRVSQMAALMAACGFEVIKLSYFQPLYFVPLLLFRRWKKLTRGDGDRPIEQRDDFVAIPPWLNGVLTRLMVAEKYVLRRFAFPFGVTLVCIGRKRGTNGNGRGSSGAASSGTA
ncbi:MAG TPA: class I SAM-dependent methyltransferase [Candidatus Acidoferrales bacterium]|nr:class I SAM-dependent methyltransferase [Candidatus Acidoferrales bacterium]